MEALEPLRRFHFTLPRLFHSDFSQRRSRWRSLPHISKWNRLCNQRDRKGSLFLTGRLLRRRRGIEHRRLGECSTPYSTNHNTVKANTSREASSNEPKMMKNTLNTISPIISLPSNSSNNPSRHLTPPFTRPSHTPSMNHFRRSFRKERQSTSSPISLLPIRQIDPYASSMLLLCISALLPMTGIEMGSSTIQISRFNLLWFQIGHMLVVMCVTKKSSTSQLRRWHPCDTSTVLFRMPRVFANWCASTFQHSVPVSKQRPINHQLKQHDFVFHVSFSSIWSYPIPSIPPLHKSNSPNQHQFTRSMTYVSFCSIS